MAAPAAFRSNWHFLECFRAQVTYFLVKKGAKREVAEDIYGDISLRFAEKSHEVPQDIWPTYIYRAARNAYVDHKRKNKRIYPIDDVQRLAEATEDEYALTDFDSVDRELFLESVARTSQFSGADFEIARLRLEGYREPDSAKLVGIPLNSLKSKVFRLRQHMKREYLSL